MAEPIKTPQQMGEAIQQAQAPVEPIQAPSNAGPVAIPETPEAPVAPQTTETQKPQDSGVLNLGGGKIVDKKSPKYQALIAKGMTDADIMKAYQDKSQKQAQTQVATVEKKPVAQNNGLDYQSVQPERKTEIIDNLNKFYQTNPEMFSDRNAFNTFFDYNDKRSPEQRQLLDAWYNQNITKKAKASNLDKTPINDIATMYSSGTLSNEDVDLLKTTNPQKYAETVQAIEKQKTAQKYKEQMLVDEKKEVTPADKILAKIDELYNNIKTPTLYDDYKKEINSDEVKALQNELSSKEGEIKEIDNQINATKSQLENEFKGQVISQGRLNALIQDQTQLLQNQRNTKAIEYQTLADKYNNKMNTIKTNLEIAEKEYAINQQMQKNQVEKYQFAYSIFADQQKRDDMFKLEDIRFDRDIEKMKINEEMQFNSAVKMDKLQNGDINSADPYIVQKAIEKGVDNLMKQYDGLIDSSRDQLVARIKEGVKSGKSYGDVMGGIMEDIKGKPLYNQWKMNKLGLNTEPKPFAPGYYTVRNPDGTTSVINEKQLQDRYNIPSAEKEAAQKAVIAERQANGGMSQYDYRGDLDKLANDPVLGVGVNCGKQCGGYTTDVLAKIMPDAGIRFGSTPESKDNAIMAIGETRPPVIGGFVSLNSSAPEGHTGWVTEVSPDGQSIKVRNSNYNGKGDTTVTENRFNISKVRKASIAPGNKGYTIGDSTIIDKPLTDDQRVVFNSQLSSFRSNAVVKAFEEGMQQYNDIKASLENPSGPGDIAGIFQFMKTLDPTSVVREAEFSAAASSAGVVDKIGNALKKLQNGEQLTDTQREAFQSLAKKYIQNRANSYNRLYSDMERVTSNMGIGKSYLPTNAANLINDGGIEISQPANNQGVGNTLDSTNFF